MVWVLEARTTLPRETRIILSHQPRQPGAGGIDERMDALPVGAGGHPIKMGFQQGPVGGVRAIMAGAQLNGRIRMDDLTIKKKCAGT
jgi:hypothetical protein